MLFAHTGSSRKRNSHKHGDMVWLLPPKRAYSVWAKHNISFYTHPVLDHFQTFGEFCPHCSKMPGWRKYKRTVLLQKNLPITTPSHPGIYSDSWSVSYTGKLAAPIRLALFKSSVPGERLTHEPRCLSHDLGSGVFLNWPSIFVQRFLLPQPARVISFKLWNQSFWNWKMRSEMMRKFTT